MSKVYLFLGKLVALTLNVLVFFLFNKYNIDFYYTIPVLLLVFALIVTRITSESPKELYNFQRSEKFFAKGGLRDLIRIPVLLVSFLHNIAVWIFWGTYQIIILIVDLLYFLKLIIFWFLQGIIWVLNQLLPFWRIVFRLFLHYIIKWPWWIYRFAFYAIKKTYNRKILRISFIGSFLALFIFHIFYFFDYLLGDKGFRYIGIIIAMLPVSWVFGEISSARGQKILHLPYKEIKSKFRNGLESVRGILVFLTAFVVLVIIEGLLNALGWIPRSGIIFLGLSINISFIINLVLIFLLVLIVFGSFILPTYRLYNDFSEVSIKDIYKLFKYITRRSFQIIFGFIPSSIFATITIIPALIIVLLTAKITLGVKDNIIDIRISKKEQINPANSIDAYRIVKEIDQLEYIKNFPAILLQEMEHRRYIEQEIEGDKSNQSEQRQKLAQYKDRINKQLNELSSKLREEQIKDVINQTTIEEIEKTIAQINYQSKIDIENYNYLISQRDVDIEFANRKYKLLPLVFYLGGLFIVVIFSFVFMFILGFYGNFFYRTYLYRNDGSPANWLVFIREEKEANARHPLLSVTLNILFFSCILAIIFWNNLIEYYTRLTLFF